MKKLSYPEHPFNQSRHTSPPQSGSGPQITPAQATAQANIVLAMLLLGILSVICWNVFA